MSILNLLKISSLVVTLVLSAAPSAQSAGQNSTPTLTSGEKKILETLIDSEERSAKTRARNKYRHPLQTLTFFGVTQDQTVVEIWPGGQGGWYRSILAPYLEQNGTYIPVRSSDDFPAPSKNTPDNVADTVLVFRAHGFMIYDKPTQKYYDALFGMVKPGGVFGIVDHRGDESIPQDPEGENGYVNQSHVIKLATKAGFKLIDSSEVNANPKDTKDYPSGLYSLPPSLKGTIFNAELRKKVLAIGESDRMTLKFVKPI